MLNGVCASSTALTAHGGNPPPSSQADIRAYLDFQILLSRVTAGQQPVVAGDTAAVPAEIPNVAPALSEADRGVQQLIAQRQFELSTRLNAEPEKVERLTLMLLADAFGAGSQLARTEPALPYPLSLV
ncbi:hypothetical protein [Pseudomonas borbori]|uniref:Uncharacterized protein n=1 Tax=Pseudomonas borbori TaxID=289003 RepID=A0A1I5Q557_9PSED|nr:hypothetical protein [Pseudomonas borbori]SFP41488.1 hypothetical protein SAMN05216190_11012 [Pseudomonas borbori]